MEVYRRSSWLLVLLLVELQIFTLTLKGVSAEGPSESECRPHIEKALKQLETSETALPNQDDGDSKEDIPTVEITTDDSDPPVGDGENEDDKTKQESNESTEVGKEGQSDSESNERNSESKEENDDDDNDELGEQVTSDEDGVPEITIDQILVSEPEPEPDQKSSAEQSGTSDENNSENKSENVVERTVIVKESIIETSDEEGKNSDDDDNDSKTDSASKENEAVKEEVETLSSASNLSPLVQSGESAEDDNSTKEQQSKEDLSTEESGHVESTEKTDSNENKDEDAKSKNDSKQENSSEDVIAKKETVSDNKNAPPEPEKDDSVSIENDDSSAVEELIEESEEVLSELRPRDHIAQLLKLDEESISNSKLVDRMSEIILRDLKKLYESAIKPLEILYKYKDLSNRHYGDSEIFAKPLILFMGPWSGGKSSIINYLLGIENTEHALHTGAEPSPAYFNILMYGEEPEVLDGTQLAADYTFSGLQKFGQGLEERLHGYKLPSKLLEKVNVVEIPGILEVRKQVSRVFPFNDACQWFIDRADIIFLVYDPSKLDVGPETEAILDQLKGREHQTRLILNKADRVKPEELMRVQGALIWNISPLMSSAQPPKMYTTSLWSKPYEAWAPVRLLQAQERAFLRDIRSAVDKRIDNKIASARRFAVRVRNHAKMVDCYLTTYYNHKSVFGNRKQISDEIINHPQDFHIYEGLSTLTNISRYDLPDPDVYREFFRLNALYEFQQLSATCTYFRGCPINRLDVAIAYDLPELVGKHKKLIETAINEANKTTTPKS